MRRTYKRAIATLTIIVMMITMMLPMGSNAETGTAGFTRDVIRILEVYPSILSNSKVAEESEITFRETTNGEVTGTFDVPLQSPYEYYDRYFDQSKLPNGLTLTITSISGAARVKISGRAYSHNDIDSTSFELTIKNRKSVSNEWSSWYENGADVIKSISIIFDDGDPSKPDQELYSLLKGNDKYDVTSMSMNKFISLRNEINGNYDIIYFGKGTYSRNTITEARYGNDITGLRADQVLEYINANQLCIFHADAFKGASEDGTSGSTPVTVMYQKFNSIKDRANVKVVNSISDSIFSDLATEFANDRYNHSPILTVTAKPQSYRISGQPLPSHNLTFSYGVYDADLGKDDNLAVELYIDINCNSLFEPFERVALRTVKNGEYGTITHNMPQQLTGIYFWKIVASDTSDFTGAKTEFLDLFRVKGDKLDINVLQIKPNTGNNASLTELFNRPVTGGMPGETLGYRPGEFEIKVTEVTVDQFNAGSVAGPTDYYLRDLNGHYDMVILGFADDYSKNTEFNAAAISELDEFIKTKQSVMFTHDSIHYKYNIGLSNQFWDDAGQTQRRGKGETAGLVGFESSSRNYSSLNNTYKLDNYQTVNTWSDEAKSVRPVNANTIGLYPYNLESVPQDQRTVAPTHYQWYKLDLEDENVVPLFNLYKDKSGERVNDDSMNNYYTYTKGNITYSGTGHKPGYTEYEIKLFINTAIKAHSIANNKPIIELKQPTGDTESITKTEIPLSFVLKDDYDTKLMYWVDVDYNNDGTYEYKAKDINGVEVSGKQTATNVEINDITIPNRLTLGEFKIRIKAKETSSPTGAESILEKVMECVKTPVIKPAVSFTDMSDPANTITSCLIGETIKINTKITASGNLSPAKNIVPKYDLTATYATGNQPINKANVSVGRFRFTAASAPNPSEINKQEELLVKPDSATILTVDTKVKYTVNGTANDEIVNGSIIVNDGQVDISVIDDQDRAVRGEVKVRDGAKKHTAGNLSGAITLNRQIGTHHYSIDNADIPTGYKFTPGSVTVKRLSDNTEFTRDYVELTGQNNHWEVVIKLTLDIGVDAKYYKMKNDSSVSYLGMDDPSNNYYMRCPINTTARYLARIEIDEINTMKVTGVKFELETKNKETPPVVIDPADAASAKIIDTPVTLTGTIPAELNAANVKQLKAINDATGVPVDGTYAGKDYYIVIELPNADSQRVKIKNVTLTFEDGKTKVAGLESSVIFGDPTTPLLR